MRFARARCAAALLTVTGTACAPKAVPAPDAAHSALVMRADALVEAGCYVCLREADALYAAVPASSPAFADAAAKREATRLLLALRSRELGFTDTWTATPDGSVTGAASLLETYRRIARLIPRGIVAGTLEAFDADVARMKAAQESITGRDRDELRRAARTDPVAAHFLVVLTCAERTGAGLPELDQLPPAVTVTPLVSYAAGACSPALAEALDRALDREPRFAEARYHRGLGAMERGALGRADAELTAAAAAFPDAPAFDLARGHLHLRLDEHEAALAAFTRVLRTLPDQRDALLGRVRSLSHLGRFTEALAGADRLIELGTWLLGDAYYWRAWNHRQLRQLDAAARDVATAAHYLFNAEVSKLAGFIAYDRSRLEEALRELETAHERQPGDCDVAFALGLVHARRSGHRLAGDGFGAAAECAAGARRATRQRLAEIDELDLAADRRAALRSRTEQTLATAARLEALAVINAARSYAAAGDAAAARTFAERARAWEQHREDAERLLRQLSR